MDSKIKSFDGTGNVKVFLEKFSIHSSLKGYENEKCAQNIASRLEARAFDVYMRLGNEDKKNPDKVKEELLKEFERGKQDRELAIHELSNRMRNADASAQTFAYKIQELVTLAYPAFNVDTCNAIAKDYFVKGLHLRMQTALKSLPNFHSVNIDELAKETTGLQIAGIEPSHLRNRRRRIIACLLIQTPLSTKSRRKC